MKKVSIRRLVQIAPELPVLTLIDIFKEFGITLEWEITRLNPSSTKRNFGKTKVKRSNSSRQRKAKACKN